MTLPPEVMRSEVQNCLNFIREYESAEVIGERELYELIPAFGEAGNE